MLQIRSNYMFTTGITNQELLEKFDKLVYGHTTAKKALINAVNRSRLRWHQEFNLGMQEDELVTPKNVLLIGESGSGKTFLIECLQKLCEFPIVRFDATQ